MVEFDVIKKKPGEVIRSEDWNTMQEDIRADLEELELGIRKLRKYIDNMQETTTLLNISSTVGKSYPLNEIIEGETSSYETEIVGLITKQWLLAEGKTGEICRFGVVTLLDSIDYWSGAENGDKKALEVVFDYMDGTSDVVSDLFVHDRSKLRPQGEDNPYLDYLFSPNEYVWYRYRVANPNPEKEVLTVSFRNTNPECTPRIGNVIHYRAKIIPAEIPTETPTE
jgi:hypothetical protein